MAALVELLYCTVGGPTASPTSVEGVVGAGKELLNIAGNLRDVKLRRVGASFLVIGGPIDEVAHKQCQLQITDSSPPSTSNEMPVT
jgi:hypothetical protein